MMNAQEIIQYIATAEKKTPVKITLREKNPAEPIDFGDAKVFGCGDRVIFGDWKHLGPIIEASRDRIDDMVIENDCRNSAIPLLDLKGVNARIEPGAIIRDQVTIGNGAVIMMGAILNIGAVVGDGSMIDMGVVMGGRATVGKRCHIGAGAVLAGVVEPASAKPVIIGDDCFVGANAVVIGRGRRRRRRRRRHGRRPRGRGRRGRSRAHHQDEEGRAHDAEDRARRGAAHALSDASPSAGAPEGAARPP